MILSDMIVVNYSSDTYVFLIHVFYAFLLSFFVGLERQYRRKTIGLRMAVLVCIGSTMFTHASLSIPAGDLGRIAAGIVSGIGFLGAGLVMKDDSHHKVHGLNTASTIWCSASIGILCGMGYIIEAVIGTLFVLISNSLLRKIDYKMSQSESDSDE